MLSILISVWMTLTLINTFRTANENICFEHDIASARKRETLVLDQYFRFGVPSVEVTAPS